MIATNQKGIHYQTYHVYGRKAYPEPLTFIDEFRILDPTALKIEVESRFGEGDWVELIAFPAKASIQVIPREADE
jgi:hypothetical protein